MRLGGRGAFLGLRRGGRGVGRKTVLDKGPTLHQTDNKMLEINKLINGLAKLHGQGAPY